MENGIMRQFSIIVKVTLLKTISWSWNNDFVFLHMPISYSSCKRKEKGVHEKIIQCSTECIVNFSTLLTLLLCSQQLVAGHCLYSFQAQRTQKNLVHCQKHQVFYTTVIYIVSAPLPWNIQCDIYLLLSKSLHCFLDET